MVILTVENYLNARVHVITVKNEELFWVKMHDVQNKLGVKRISDILGKEIRGIYENKNPTSEPKKKYIKSCQKINK